MPFCRDRAFATSGICGGRAGYLGIRKKNVFPVVSDRVTRDPPHTHTHTLQPSLLRRFHSNQHGKQHADSKVVPTSCHSRCHEQDSCSFNSSAEGFVRSRMNRYPVCSCISMSEAIMEGLLGSCKTSQLATRLRCRMSDRVGNAKLGEIGLGQARDS